MELWRRKAIKNCYSFILCLFSVTLSSSTFSSSDYIPEVLCGLCKSLVLL